MNSLTENISELIKQAQAESKGNPQKKYYNKVIARLEEAWLWSKQIEPSVADQLSETCSCPAGAVDSTCPVHGQK